MPESPVTVSIQLPFSGFYNSWYSQAIDDEEKQFCEWESESDEENREGSFPKELRLNQSELFDIIFKHTSYSAAYQHIAKEYVASFSRIIGEEIGIPLALEFEEMTSPREYNFETDRIFARIPFAAIEAMFERSAADGHKTLCETIEERHTSRDGFHSFYTNDLAGWLEKPLAEWDHNELQTLLLATMQLAGIGERSEWNMSVYEDMSEAGDFYHAWADAVDWDAFEKACGEARADKEAELRKYDPDFDDSARHYHTDDPRQASLPLKKTT